jgi:hypothetical protein
VAQITSVNAANAIVKLVATDAMELLIGTLVMGNLVNRDFEQSLATQGDTVNVPIPPTLVANNIAEGGTVQNQVASLGNAQVVLNTHAEASFQIGDIVKVLASQDLSKMFVSSAVAAIAERIETDIMRAYPLFTDQAVIGGAAVIDEPKVDDVETAMFLAKVPLQEPKYLVVSAGTYSDLRLIPRFTEYQNLGDSAMAVAAIAGGVMGKIKNLNVIRSHFVQQSAGPIANNICFSRNALALVTRRLPAPLPGTGAIVEYAEMGNFGMRVVMSYAPGTLAQQFTIDCLYGVSTLRNSWGIQVRTNTP